MYPLLILKFGFEVNNSGANNGYGSGVGGIVGFIGPGSDNDTNIGQLGTTIKACNFSSNNTVKQEIIFAKQDTGASPNAGGIVGISFNNCSIINTNVSISNGIIISQRLLENTTQASYGATSGGIIGRMEHTGTINGCTVTGNNLDIISESTESEIYSGGIVGVDVGPYHRKQISLLNNKFIGNNTSKITTKIISENGKTNKFIGSGGIAGSSTYIVTDCNVSGVIISNEGANAETDFTSVGIGKVIGIMKVTSTLWKSGDVTWTPDETIGIINCSSIDTTVTADNNSVSLGEMYGIEY